MRALRIHSCVLALVWGVAFAGGAAAAGVSGFLPGTQGAAPVQGTYEGEPPKIAIADPKNKTIVVYSHGTRRPQHVEDCSKSSNRVPRSLMEALNVRRDGGALVYYLCSRATEQTTRTTAGEYIYKRMAEVEHTLDQLIAAGVEPKRIFLAGHSAGGWTSLMMGRTAAKKFNSVIAFAPAFAGPRSETEQYPWWRKVARPKQVAEMTKPPRLEALVFAYADDPFNRPEDLDFLAKRYPQSVKLVGYDCPLVKRTHLTHLDDCREDKTTALSRDYVKRRVGE